MAAMSADTAPAAMPREEELERTLRAVAAAYPEDAFPEITSEERARLCAQDPGLQDRIAASMGRFLAKHLLAAADALSGFAPILAEKERRIAEWQAEVGREGDRYKDEINDLNAECDRLHSRALAAEAALAAERERCAKVAEGVSTFEWRGGDEWAAGYVDGKNAAAAAIREQGE